MATDRQEPTAEQTMTITSTRTTGTAETTEATRPTRRRRSSMPVGLVLPATAALALALGYPLV
ncbi:MAG: hypothetical protein J2P22_19905, partial [Nocardioides sp.]|nr:hypothetical protein [Nocardioides sp.]